MLDKRSLNYLGIAKRSGNLICGTDMVVKSLSTGKIKIILLAKDASSNTKDKIIKKAFYYQIQVCEIFDSFCLSKAVGKDPTGVPNGWYLRDGAGAGSGSPADREGMGNVPSGTASAKRAGAPAAPHPGGKELCHHCAGSGKQRKPESFH